MITRSCPPQYLQLLPAGLFAGFEKRREPWPWPPTVPEWEKVVMMVQRATVVHTLNLLH